MDGLQRSVPGGRYRGTRGVPIGTPPVANLLLHAPAFCATPVCPVRRPPTLTWRHQFQFAVRRVLVPAFHRNNTRRTGLPRHRRSRNVRSTYSDRPIVGVILSDCHTCIGAEVPGQTSGGQVCRRCPGRVRVGWKLAIPGPSIENSVSLFGISHPRCIPYPARPAIFVISSTSCLKTSIRAVWVSSSTFHSLTCAAALAISSEMCDIRRGCRGTLRDIGKLISCMEPVMDERVADKKRCHSEAGCIADAEIAFVSVG